MQVWKKWMIAGVVASVGVSVSPAAMASTFSAAQSGPEVEVMVIAPTKTQIANFPDIPAAAYAAVKNINKRAGVGTRKQRLKVVYCNDNFTANGAAACARQAVDRDVAAVIGGVSSFGGSILPVLERGGIAAFGIWPSAGADFTSPNAFPLGTGTLGGYVGQAKAAKDAGKKNLAVTSASSTSATPWRVKAGAKIYGLTFKGLYDVPPTTKDYAPVISQLQRNGVEAVSLAVGGVQATQLISAADQLGYRPLWLNADGNMSTENLRTLGPLAKGIVFVGSMPPSSATSSNAAMRRLAKEYKGYLGGFEGSPLGSTGASAWLAFQAFEQLTKSMPAVNARSVLVAAKSAKNIDLGGILPPWTPSKLGPKTFPRISNPFLYVSKWTGSKQELVSAKPFDASAVFAKVPN